MEGDLKSRVLPNDIDDDDDSQDPSFPYLIRDCLKDLSSIEPTLFDRMTVGLIFKWLPLC